MSFVCGVRPYTVHRHEPPTLVLGDWVKGAASTFTVEGSLQPVQDRELLALPEGQRQRARWKLYAPGPRTLRTVGDVENDGNVADRVEVDGVLYEVLFVREYRETDTSLNHVRYVLIMPQIRQEVAP